METTFDGGLMMWIVIPSLIVMAYYLGPKLSMMLGRQSDAERKEMGIKID